MVTTEPGELEPNVAVTLGNDAPTALGVVRYPTDGATVYPPPPAVLFTEARVRPKVAVAVMPEQFAACPATVRATVGVLLV
jgi:hypothetical protein